MVPRHRLDLRTGLWVPCGIAMPSGRRRTTTIIRGAKRGHAGTVNPGAGATGGGAPPFPPTITGVSRDIVSAAGGTSVTITGTLPALTGITVGGTTATITEQSDSAAVFIAPAKAVNAGYDIVATNALGSHTLTGALEYGPIATTVFASADFEDGTTGGFTKSASASVSTEAAHSGTKCLKCSSGDGANSSLNKSFGNNPARAEANGVWTRWWVMLPQAAIDAVAAGQIKLYLHRFGDFGAHPESKPGIMLGTGLEFRGNNVAAFVDYGIHNTSGINVTTGAAFTNGNCGSPFVDGQWKEILQQERHDGVTSGYMSVWLNGKRAVRNFPHADLFGNGVDATGAPATNSYGIRMGIAFTQHASAYPIVAYVDDAWTGNGVPV